ncbi:acyl-CoA dehydrogenase C-terminal domain-containing protein [Shewanella corallii]|uniref:Acyl-CoA dehydrogenase C-terminal domain-containing protein n=1 Tax=Shewanella corallii TaxID=560080 RepID=A0ABT0N958_9GAMM|nr:acyl-CoA dehydrogenase family protein [Shewanella corallii]MCL2914976.1 acyl-CoA dehydrogenase C-terminal domain-containing protein [Shewanella corallii]
MYPYEAPLKDMQFVLENVFGASDVWSQLPALSEHIDTDTAAAILEEAARINQELVHPINRSGDEEGVKFTDGKVTTPAGYKEVYQQFAEGGWVGLCGEPDFGGMGMPKMLGVLVDEMGYGANNAFTLYNSLTAGAALCINAHASEELKAQFLPQLYSGQWSGAMDMTEPQAGSDLRNIRTRAEPCDDGSYLISGSKIFITGGDHDLAENIIHLVLAKLPGSNGISLFLVPKIQVSEDGVLGEPNGVTAGSIEHKMGLKASATCVMNFDNAKGYLIGKPNRGLVCMFTMMNYERLAIGIQGLGTSQAASQMAVQYAKERLQGQAASGARAEGGSDPIIVHGDVRRMLLNIKSLTEAGRALAVHTGMQLDLAKYAEEPDTQSKAARYVGLLTPVAKAFLTDRGLDAAILAQQVFGGHGYIRETGVEQLVRDTRIAQIYEGTNGIQAIDFLARKVVGDNLVTLKQFIDELKSEMANFTDDKAVAEVTLRFERLLECAEMINTDKLSKPALLNACAVEFLDAFGYTLYGYYWLAIAHKAAEMDEEFASAKSYLCSFYIQRMLPKADALLAQILSGHAPIMEMPADLF